ncbi:MAG: hypothetical protein WCC76_15290 [Candidatus Acidiferrales bacterium]
MTGATRIGQIKIAVMTVPLLLVLLYPLQKRIAIRTNFLENETGDTLFATGPMLKKLSLGYDSLLADIYWTRVVQYYGARLGHAGANFDQLAPLLNVTTTLDPHLLIAYRFGGTFLAEGQPIGAGRPDLGADLVKRGIAANPDEWQLYSDLGTIYYWHTKNYQAAAQAFWQGGDIAGAPPWMKPFAAHIAQEGMSRGTSRFMWSQVYKEATDERIRRNAMNHLKELQTEADLEALTQIAAAYKKQFGHFPASGADVLAAGMARAIPKDPAGYAYRMSSNGTPSVDPASPIAALLKELAQQ